MLTITKDYFFSASHSLKFHEGKCRRLHGHNYKVEVSIRGEPNQVEGSSTFGMIMDFSDLDKLVQPWLDEVDHYDLNERAQDPKSDRTEVVLARKTLPKYPTAENLVLGLVSYLRELENLRFIGRGVLQKVVVWETEKARATWERNES